MENFGYLCSFVNGISFLFCVVKNDCVCVDKQYMANLLDINLLDVNSLDKVNLTS